MKDDQELSQTGDASRTVLGSAMLVVGAVLTVLAVVDHTGGLPLDMPRFWYINRWLWPALAFALCVLGTLSLWSGARPAEWRPSRPGRRFDTLVLYTRSTCHLCDQAKAVLLKYAHYLPSIEEIDVDDNPELAARYGPCVPVVVIDGKARFRGRVDERLLRRLIEGTAPKPEHQKAADG